MITGGAGFIGTNLAEHCVEAGHRVLLFDNLSRAGVDRNLRWLLERYGDAVEFVPGDVRDLNAVQRVMQRATGVFHLAAQVAVTTSLVDPIEDFEVNACGTLNVLESLRRLPDPPPLVFTSTNKVYGALEHIHLERNGTRYYPAPEEFARGIGEDQKVDFHSPYGCSKGAADQYVVDYARTYRLPAAVFRMSCIYGPHQMGTEDQGWVAHFLIRALQDEPIAIYGDGLQVRDILFVEDLVEAVSLAHLNIDRVAGRCFNIGGGPENTISLLELLDLIARIHHTTPKLEFRDWRAADQRYYVSDTTRFRNATQWEPRVSVFEGVQQLYAWLLRERGAAEAEVPRRKIRSEAIGGRTVADSSASSSRAGH